MRERKVAAVIISMGKGQVCVKLTGVITSDHGKVIDSNKTLGAIFGYSPAELLGMKAVDLVCSEDREKVQDRIVSGYEKRYEVNGLKRDGTEFPMEAHAKMFSYKGNKVRVTALRDLTAQKKAEEEI